MMHAIWESFTRVDVSSVINVDVDFQKEHLVKNQRSTKVKVFFICVSTYTVKQNSVFFTVISEKSVILKTSGLSLTYMFKKCAKVVPFAQAHGMKWK